VLDLSSPALRIDFSRIEQSKLVFKHIDDFGSRCTEEGSASEPPNYSMRARAVRELNRRRVLTIDMIYEPDTEWKLSAEISIEPYRLKTAWHAAH